MSFYNHSRPGREHADFVKTSGSGQRIHSRYLKYAGKYCFANQESDSFVWGNWQNWGGDITFGMVVRERVSGQYL